LSDFNKALDAVGDALQKIKLKDFLVLNSFGVNFVLNLNRVRVCVLVT
jgi:hypothetical protein